MPHLKTNMIIIFKLNLKYFKHKETDVNSKRINNPNYWCHKTLNIFQ